VRCWSISEENEIVRDLLRSDIELFWTSGYNFAEGFGRTMSLIYGVELGVDGKVRSATAEGVVFVLVLSMLTDGH
jgi:hypothetical protein